MIFVILSTSSDRDIQVGHAGFCGLQKDIHVVCAAGWMCLVGFQHF